MGVSLAAALLASLLAASTLDLEAGVRGEGRSSVLAPAGSAALRRESLSASPRAALSLELPGARAAAEYAPRLWTSDAGRDAEPLVDHTVAARLETRHLAPWRLEVGGTATRGRTDPLADAATAAAASSSGQLTSTSPMPYEALRGAGRVEVQLDPRTTLSGGAAFSTSTGTTAAARVLLPAQRTTAADAAATWRATPRTTLRLGAEGAFTETDAATGQVQGAFGTLSARATSRLAPRLTGVLGAGGSFVYDGAPGAPSPRQVLPAGLLGLLREGEGSPVALELGVRLGPSADRLTGRMRSLADATAALRWRVATGVTLSTTASGGAFLGGETLFAALDARLAWELRRGLSLEAGALARAQRERRAELPSYREAGAVLALAYRATARVW